MLLIPLEYFLACCFITMVPMMFLDMVAWLVTAPLWWTAAWVITRVNPHAHVLIKVMWQKTRRALFQPRGRRTYGL
jgi:hypothetical protein